MTIQEVYEKYNGLSQLPIEVGSIFSIPQQCTDLILSHRSTDGISYMVDLWQAIKEEVEGSKE